MQKKHIHIVGCVPRSGTTLMTELMTTCFDIDGYTEHEYSVFKEFTSPCEILCTKNPNDIKRISYPLAINPNLYVIYLLRDPRDAISSRSHKNNKNDKKIWSNLKTWKEHHEIAQHLEKNPHFITVKYEDLVTEPDKVQRELQKKLPFLEVKCLFSEYHLQAKPSNKSEAALGGLRPISPQSIGNWAKNKPYLKAQIEKYGDISDLLIQLGYEADTKWLSELDGVVPDNQDEIIKQKSWFKLWKEKNVTLKRRQWLYKLSLSPTYGRAISLVRRALRIF
ncbi:sulfotransferase family protein [Methylophaga sp.]|uniref:sulfotransferase family protein n=1 Tax=Methylophaga sp. TaxID=2024840 RepID=UPI003F6A4CEF